jgi:hypothetical protein
LVSVPSMMRLEFDFSFAPHWRDPGGGVAAYQREDPREFTEAAASNEELFSLLAAVVADHSLHEIWRAISARVCGQFSPIAAAISLGSVLDSAHSVADIEIPFETYGAY